MSDTKQTPLETITRLSHDFGIKDYVKGGGGNTSVKDEQTLWVKPSGTTLLTLTPEKFVAMDRAKLAELNDVEPPAEQHAREALIKEFMAAAVLPSSSGRPSVEAPLHNTISACYVVHTHPSLVNGLTCGLKGKALCEKLFPEALWLDYIDPGYTLCMEVREQIKAFAAERGAEPAFIFLKNHGVFVSGETEEEIRSHYGTLFDRLKAFYREAEVSLDLSIADCPPQSRVDAATEQVRQVLGSDWAAHVCASGPFAYSVGPVTPDHIVYSKSYPLVGDPTAEAVESFKAQHGYLPWVIVYDDMILGLGATETKAQLALEFAQDSAIVQQLTKAFGGLDLMTDRAREFIETWEVEAYRSKQL